MPDGILEFLKMTGTAGLMFVIFYIYHKSVCEQMLQNAKQLNEIIQSGFKLFEKLTEQGAMQLGYLQKIDTEVSNNMWCPYVRKKSGDKNND